MSEIKFNVNQFQALINTAKKLAKDGISQSEKVELLKKANADGIITEDERLFIKALSNDVNLKKVTEFGKAESSMILDVDNYSEDEEATKEIKDASYKDIGLIKFNPVMKDKSISSDTLKKQILEDNTLKNNKNLSSKVNNFISNIASDKEGLVYLKELLNRDPKLSTDKLEKLLDKLNEMIKTKYDSRITNSGYSTKSLVISALHDISAPSNISQDNIGACAGTTIQIQLALKSPIEYLKMIDLLAKNESYKDIKTNWTFTKEGLSENSSTNRSISSKIMQNAIMDYSNGAEIYDSTNLDSEGLGSDETLKGLNNLFDNNLITYAYEDYSNYILGMLKLANPSKENPIQIDMNYEKKGRDSLHAVNVIGIDNNNVTIINPWGREETFSTKELENKVMKINAQKGLDFLIPKLTTKGLVDVDSLFNRKISSPFTDGVSNAINESKGKAEFLKDLNSDEKINLIKKLHTGSITDDDKKAMLKILENMFSGSQPQNEKMVSKIWNGLIDDKGSKISLITLLDDVKMDTKLYRSVASKIYEAVASDDSDKARFLYRAKDSFDPKTEYGKEYMNSLIKSSDDSEIADNLINMVKMYISSLDSDNTNSSNTVAKDSIKNFIDVIKESKSKTEYRKIMLNVADKLTDKEVKDTIKPILSNPTKKADLQDIFKIILKDSGALIK